MTGKSEFYSFVTFYGVGEVMQSWDWSIKVVRLLLVPFLLLLLKPFVLFCFVFVHLLIEYQEQTLLIHCWL